MLKSQVLGKAAAWYEMGVGKAGAILQREGAGFFLQARQ